MSFFCFSFVFVYSFLLLFLLSFFYFTFVVSFLSTLFFVSLLRCCWLFDGCVVGCVGYVRLKKTSITLPPKSPPIETDDLNLEPDEVKEPSPLDADPDPISEDGTTVFDLPITDALIHAKVSLPQGEKMLSGKVIGRAKDHDGKTTPTSIGGYGHEHGRATRGVQQEERGAGQ